MERAAGPEAQHRRLGALCDRAASQMLLLLALLAVLLPPAAPTSAPPPGAGAYFAGLSAAGVKVKLGRVRSPSPDKDADRGGPTCGSLQPAPVVNPLRAGTPFTGGGGAAGLHASRLPSDLGFAERWAEALSRGGDAPKFYEPVVDHYPMDYFGVSTRGDLLPSKDALDKGVSLSPEEVTSLCEELRMDRWGTPSGWGIEARPERAIFCSHTLNLRSIRCIGYDMDYTLIHYKVVAWEGRAYHYAKENLLQVGFPVSDLEFDPTLVCRGLVIDRELGNMIKVDRFGTVRRVMHGTKRMSFREGHAIYGGQIVDLRDNKRFVFLNTLFSVSEGCLYMQLVEKWDQQKLVVRDGPTGEKLHFTYDMLFNAVSKALFKAHVEGRLKADVVRNPEKYVEFDHELPLTLLDQKEAGKKLALITNSDWNYTKSMMNIVFDRFLPTGVKWRDLFDVIIVSARKPSFFTQSMPLHEIVTEDGLMKEKFRMKQGRVYSGGSASHIEKLFGASAEEIAYIGDHIFTDVNVAKGYMRWKTVLIVRELEEEVVAMKQGMQDAEDIKLLMKQKDKCANVLNHLRTEMNRHAKGRPTMFRTHTEADMHDLISRLLVTIVQLDTKIAILLWNHGSRFNPNWGYMSRAGLVDKSHLIRQIEKYADLYTSRVSNFLRYTPYMYFRSSQLSVAHHQQYRAANANANANANADANADADTQETERGEVLHRMVKDTVLNRQVSDWRCVSDEDWEKGLTNSRNLTAPPTATAGLETAMQETTLDGNRAPATIGTRRGMVRVGSKEFGHEIGPSGVPQLDAQPEVSDDREDEDPRFDGGTSPTLLRQRSSPLDRKFLASLVTQAKAEEGRRAAEVARTADAHTQVGSANSDGVGNSV